MKPLTALREAAVALNSGNFDVRVDVRAADELGQVGAAFNDMTRRLKESFGEHQAFETALKKSEESYRQLFEQAADGIFITDGRGNYIDANASGLRMLGYSRDEILRLDITEVLTPEEAASMPPGLEKLHEGAQILQRRRLRRKDGSEVETEVSATMLPDGRLLGVVRDVSLQTKAEAEKDAAERQLLQSQKMEAVGRLAGGIAHDFNNLLAVIMSYAEFVAEGLSEGDPRHADIDEVVKAARKAAVLTRQLLAFSRKGAVKPEVMQLNKVVAEMEKLLKRTIGEHMHLTLLLEPSIPNVKADAGQIEQVLMNLVVNARDAMPGGGDVTIATAVAEVDGEFAGRHGISPGRFVTLTVRDTGVGMTAETAGRIFEPFFTTKEKGKGTGLGLSTVFGIATQSRGCITVESAPGKGAAFTVYLPATDEEVTTSAAARGPGSADCTGETILVVEDEDAVRQLAVRILRKCGYRVLEAANAGEAFLVCEDEGGRIDVVLTDVIMPRMSGREMAERLRKTCPGFKLVYMSGYTDDELSPEGVLDGSITLIHKPFNEKDLLSKIREVLDSETPA